MTKQEMRDVVDEISFRDWLFHTDEMGDGLFLQVQFIAPDVKIGVKSKQSGRKWYLSPHMTRGEIVQTALAAVLLAVEHEAREEFTYRGRAIFGPHFDLDGLIEACDEKRLEMRPRSPLKEGI